MKVLIIGKSGQLANELLAIQPDTVQVEALGREDIDICNKDELQTYVNALSPEVIINASAYTAVDKAESDIENAYLINELAVENLAVVSKKINCRFIHISTDFIFDGEKNTAYKVDDSTAPQSVYGASKLAGETAILQTYRENSIIVRTSWVYSSFGSNFVKTMIRLMNEKDELGVVGDQIGCPTYAKNLAEFLWKLAAIDEFQPVYHWSDSGTASWYDFAVAIQELGLIHGLINKRIPVNAIKSCAYPTPAKRPKFSLLDCSEAQNIQPSIYWREALDGCLMLLKK